MNSIERKKAIIQALKINGSVNISELAEELHVSGMTIRRDLNQFSKEGIVTLTHGGAVINTGALFEFGINFKQDENVSEKRAIAKHCAALAKEGDSVFLDAGTSVKEIAGMFINKKNIVVLTHSLMAANILSIAPCIRVIMCPGEFRETSMAYMGPLTDEFIKRFKIDLLFLGVEGVDLKSGVSVPDILDGATKKTLVEKAEKIICAADHSKFNKSFLYSVAPLNKLHAIVTDSGIDPEIAETYRANHINLIIAE